MKRAVQQQRRRTAATNDEGRARRPRRTPVRTSYADRLRYLFDNSMARGTSALIAWLCLVTVVLISAFALVVALLPMRSDDDPHAGGGFFHELFTGLLHALDPGTIANDEGPWPFLITMLLLTLGGLFIVSALIGVIAAGIDNKLAELRRGRSLVLEEDHTVVLGWSDSIFTIVKELTIANESRRRPVLVVLADRDKVEMEQDLRAKVGDFRGTRLVCRSGSPMDIDDLALTSHPTARSVILLAPEGSDDPDAEVIKSLLALNHAGEDGPRIVAEIRNPTNLEAARIVGGGRTVLLDIRDTVAKLIVQTSRQSGAAAVYTELFDFGGAEIYFMEEHALAGSTYAEAQLALEGATVIGLLHDDGPLLNPDPGVVIGDEVLIVVAEDDSALREDPATVAHELPDSPPEVVRVDQEPSETLLIGWNQRAPIVVRELDKYAAPGSHLTVLTALRAPAPDELAQLSNLEVRVVCGQTTDRGTLERHLGDGVGHVVVLCYSDDLGPQAADARTLVTLLHVRDILARGDRATSIVTEMLDDRNRVLAQVAHVDDVVVSGEIVSLLVTQISEDHRLEKVFQQLLGDVGSEIYLRPAEWYVEPGGEVEFAAIVAGATRRGETAIGYKSAALATGTTSFGVRVNPAKSEVFEVLADDRVVVLADS